MAERTVTFVLQTADRTRSAQLTVVRSMRASDVIKTGSKRWALRIGANYQLANLTTGRQLLANDRLSGENVRDGDQLVLQPLPTHGR